MRTTTATTASTIDTAGIGPALNWHEDDLAVHFGPAPLASDAPSDEIGVLSAAGLAVLAMTVTLVTLGSLLLG